MNELELVQSLIDQVNKLRPRDKEKVDALQRRAKMIISRIFGDSSKYLNDLGKIYFFPDVFAHTDEQHYNEIWLSGKGRMSNLLNTMMEELKLFGIPKKVSNATKVRGTLSNRVFVVHGHDEALKQAVARILEKIGLEPIILHERPSKGRTVIEKFVDSSDVSFAVVLLSPDDVAYQKDQSPQDAKFRARQNVIFELGFFIGKLGRDHVLVIHDQEKNFEMPSDYSGILYVPYDSSNRWQFELVKELKACGYDVDANKLI